MAPRRDFAGCAVVDTQAGASGGLSFSHRNGDRGPL
jgi:hypothetical protein